MIVYEFILTIDKKLLQNLHSKNLIRYSIFRDIDIYEFYMNEKRTIGCMQARTNTADKFCVSEETVSKTLQRLNSSIEKQKRVGQHLN